MTEPQAITVGTVVSWVGIAAAVTGLALAWLTRRALTPN